MEMPRYFVTATGLVDAFRDPRVLKALTEVLHGEAKKSVVDDYLSRGLIDVDRRPGPQVDHNLIVLSGAVDRLHEVLDRTAAPRTPEQTRDDEAIQDLRTVPRKLYRLSTKATKVTPEDVRKLPSGARRVLVALRQENVGTTKTLAEHTGLNRRTVENAISSLRKARLIETADFEGK